MPAVTERDDWLWLAHAVWDVRVDLTGDLPLTSPEAAPLRERILAVVDDLVAIRAFHHAGVVVTSCDEWDTVVRAFTDQAQQTDLHLVRDVDNGLAAVGLDLTAEQLVAGIAPDAGIRTLLDTVELRAADAALTLYRQGYAENFPPLAQQIVGLPDWPTATTDHNER